MTMTNMTPADEVRVMNQFENDILEVVEDQMRNDEDSMTQSDLQGRVMAITRIIFKAGMDYQKNLDDFAKSKKGGE